MIMNPYGKSALLDENPLLSGVNAPGNSLTSQGPATEPMDVNAMPMDPRKKQMAMMLMAQQMQQMGQQGPSALPMRPRQALDIYGQPIQGA